MLHRICPLSPLLALSPIEIGPSECNKSHFEHKKLRNSCTLRSVLISFVLLLHRPLLFLIACRNLDPIPFHLIQNGLPFLVGSQLTIRNSKFSSFYSPPHPYDRNSPGIGEVEVSRTRSSSAAQIIANHHNGQVITVVANKGPSVGFSSK